uniref:Uncharacterized protein n=1 Tax=Phlebotomus papatasi TaxID=29031 RepID=A0A1B0D1W4_PHLPP
MGAKASTANGGEHQHHHQQSPRTRTFSTSSSSDVVNGGGAGFNLLRAIPRIQMTATSSQDRQRARSLSSVPDLQNAAGGDAAGASGGHDTLSIQPFEHHSLSPDDPSPLEAHVASALTLNRVFTATSLPSHWSLNGTYRAGKFSETWVVARKERSSGIIREGKYHGGIYTEERVNYHIHGATFESPTTNVDER